MGSTYANKTIDKLRSCFAAFGCPEKNVSDGGPPFQSEELHYFLISIGIGLIFSIPYHPQSNGRAKSSVGNLRVLY